MMKPPVEPMLAKLSEDLPAGDDFLYEPKWDGFRCLVFRDGGEPYLQSRELKPLDRYFPELIEPLARQIPERCALDGEIVIAGPEGLAFEALLLRIHPAASRVKLLAQQTPASYVAFDLLALDGEDLLDRPLSERREKLERALGKAKPPIHLTPATRDLDVARDWFSRFEGAGLDGVVAKHLGGRYVPGKREMIKVKHARTADCVVAGFRWHKKGPVVGSLLLGLYDDAGRLQHVGVSASFSMARRAELLDEIAPYRMDTGDQHVWAGTVTPERIPGGEPSRWNAKKDLSWEPLRPELVVEVAYDHMEGSRFRHTAQFRNWRPDRDPASCTYEQLERPVRFDLVQVLTSG
ncbi:MAG: ATP-dependent DNA ligase, partial [Myxococcales bacterium]